MEVDVGSVNVEEEGDEAAGSMAAGDSWFGDNFKAAEDVAFDDAPPWT